MQEFFGLATVHAGLVLCAYKTPTRKLLFPALFFLSCLFLAVLGLHCCMGLSLFVVSRGYSLVTGHRVPIAVASFVVEHGF